MRKEKVIQIDKQGRDFGKSFFIREMGARRVERWAIRAFLALAKSGAVLPDDVKNTGVAGIAQLGLTAFTKVNFDDAEPLLDEMLECVEMMPDTHRPQVKRSLVEGDIEELSTLLKLRTEVFNLHVSF